MKGKPSPIKSPVAQVTKCASEKISNCNSSPDKELCFSDVPSDTSKDKSTPSISKSPSKAGNKAPMPTGQTRYACITKSIYVSKAVREPIVKSSTQRSA
jgi:hypothetical protein